MGFKADKVVKKLEWDFRPFLDEHGTTPEPTDDQVIELQEQQRANLESLGVEVTDEKSIVEAMAKLTDAQMRDIMASTITAVAKCASQDPSEEVLRELPFRIKQAYFGWFMGELFDPESVAGVTKPSPGARPVGRNSTLRGVS